MNKDQSHSVCALWRKNSISALSGIKKNVSALLGVFLNGYSLYIAGGRGRVDGGKKERKRERD